MTTMQHEIHKLIDMDQLKQDMQIDPNDLNAAILQQTSLYAHYMVLASKARRQRDAAKNRLSAIENVLNAQYRKTLKAENPKATEGEISAAVGRDARFRAAQEQLLEAEQVAYLCDTTMYAMNQRRDMLQLLVRDPGSRGAAPLMVSDPTAATGTSRMAAISEARRENLLATMRRNEQADGVAA